MSAFFIQTFSDSAQELTCAKGKLGNLHERAEPAAVPLHSPFARGAAPKKATVPSRLKQVNCEIATKPLA